MTMFTDENIVEPIMRYYKDYNYVQYILNLPFEDGFKLYLKCIENINRDEIKKVWLIEIQNGYKGDFESYYQENLLKNENKILGRNFRENESKRIIEEISNKKDVKMKEMSVIL